MASPLRWSAFVACSGGSCAGSVRSQREPVTGDAVDHGVGGRETRRDLVVAGLAQHDPGDRRPLAVDPADGPEGEAAAGRVVRAGLDADEPVVPEQSCRCCARCRRPAASRSVWRRCSRTPAGAWPDRRCAPGRRRSTRLRRRSRSGRCSGCGSCPATVRRHSSGQRTGPPSRRPIAPEPRRCCSPTAAAAPAAPAVRSTALRRRWTRPTPPVRAGGRCRRHRRR